MIIKDIAAAIKRNPRINRVIVSADEHAKIKDEFANLSNIKPSPRPTYRGRFGEVDRFLWDELQGVLKAQSVQILGRPVEIDYGSQSAAASSA